MTAATSLQQAKMVSLRKQLLWLFAIVASIKAIFLMLDSRPGFYLGDSQEYVGTALINYIPLDRSFTYGWLIRAVALTTHSMAALIFLQVALSAFACWLLCYLLLKYFRVRFSVAAIIGIVCSIEPLQLVMERFVMTDSVGNSLFACFFAVAVAYLFRGSLWTLIAAQVIGVVLISIRVAYLPHVLSGSVIIPLLSPKARDICAAAISKLRKRATSINRKHVRAVAVHLLISLGLCQGLLIGYERLNGHLTKLPPAIFYQSGIFLLADLMPIVQPGDCPIPSQRDALFSGLKFDTRDVKNRFYEHWAPGEICDRMARIWPDEYARSEVANETAINALERDPFGAVKLTWDSFLLYFDVPWFRSLIIEDQGGGRVLPADFVRDLETKFHLQNPRSLEPSLTKSWQLKAVPWYLFVLCMLPLTPLMLIGTSGALRAGVFLSVIYALMFFGEVTLTIDRLTARYLTTPAWLLLLLLGIGIQQIINWKSNKRERLRRTELQPI